MEAGETTPQGEGEAVCWDPARFVRSFDIQEARYSRGFLRCRPERWFPAFGAQWLPLAHSLGAELRLVEVKPLLVMPRGLDAAFAGSVDGEPIAVLFDADSSRAMLEAVVPGSSRSGSDVVLEYIARRLLGTLALSWSGPESSRVQFHPEMNPFEAVPAGGVKCTFIVNNAYATLWIALGRQLLDRLDGLWRRQVQSVARRVESEVLARIEVAQLAVPPSMLGDYTRPGAIIDLEIQASDSAVIRSDGRAWLPARIVAVDKFLGFEVTQGPIVPAQLPEGTTRLSIEFGTVTLDAQSAAEIAQVGAVWQSTIPLSSEVNLVVNGERVGGGTLCVYEGRFAVRIPR